MIYFEAKSDRVFLEEFLRQAREYADLNQVKELGSGIDEIKKHFAKKDALRTVLSRNLTRANKIADKHEIEIICLDGSSGNKFNVFAELVRKESGPLISDENVIDIINETIGACSEAERLEFWKVINPVYWGHQLLAGILKIPFWIFKTAGFKTDSFEKSLAGSVIKLINVMGILFLLLYFGFSDSELKEVLKSKRSI